MNRLLLVEFQRKGILSGNKLHFLKITDYPIFTDSLGKNIRNTRGAILLHRSVLYPRSLHRLPPKPHTHTHTEARKEKRVRALAHTYRLLASETT